MNLHLAEGNVRVGGRLTLESLKHVALRLIRFAFFLRRWAHVRVLFRAADGVVG